MEHDKKYSWIWIVAVIIIVVAIVVLTNQNNTLQEYKTPEETTAVEIGDSKDDYNNFQTYVDDTLNLSIKVPNDWVYVYKDDIYTFIHKASETSIEFSKTNYIPSYNNASEDTVKQNVTDSGYTLSEFNWITNTSYICSYYNEKWIYIEYITWDRNHVCNIVCTTPYKNYDRMYETIMNCLDGFTWEKENPIENGYFLHYFEQWGYECAVPDKWGTDYNETQFYISDSSTGSSVTVTSYETTEDLSGITQVSYTEYASKNRQSYLQSSYNNDGTSLYSDATYINGSIKYDMHEYMIATGTHQYIIIMESPYDNYEAISPIFNKIIEYFRYF